MATASFISGCPAFMSLTSFSMSFMTSLLFPRAIVKSIEMLPIAVVDWISSTPSIPPSLCSNGKVISRSTSTAAISPASMATNAPSIPTDGMISLSNFTTAKLPKAIISTVNKPTNTFFRTMNSNILTFLPLSLPLTLSLTSFSNPYNEPQPDFGSVLGCR